jgi:putative ABC transport system permease protein
MLWDAIVLALREIRRNVLRSALTILGVVIGVAAVITMVTIGGGATERVTSDISQLGSNMLIVRPGQRHQGPGGARTSARPLDVDDVAAMGTEVAGVAAVAPASSRRLLAIYGNENWSTTVTGTDNGYLAVRDWPIALGRVFTTSELRSGGAACILGHTVRSKLFGAQDPLDASIRLEQLSCRVVGVLASKGSTLGNDSDDLVLVPLRTLQRRIAGTTDVDMVFISAADGADTARVQKDLEALLRQRRRIAEGKEDDFFVMDMQEVVKAVSGATRVLTGLLGAVAAVSLLVGGIGIMNIMLVSVTERTREIGIRLAIGAMAREVLLQFLVEAVVLSSLGGVVGTALGLAGGAAGAHFLGVPFVLDPTIVVVAFLFSAAVGVVFGFWPARQAARLNPIDALRHE